MKNIDLRNYPETIDALNKIVNNGNEGIVKLEPKGLTTVELVRKVKHRELKE